MALINMMEMIVRPKLTEMLKDVDCCKCEKCYLDMLAYALNKLKPMYVNSREGELFSKLSTTHMQSTVDICAAIMTAINVVKDSPHHDIAPEISDFVPDDVPKPKAVKSEVHKPEEEPKPEAVKAEETKPEVTGLEAVKAEEPKPGSVKSAPAKPKAKAKAAAKVTAEESDEIVFPEQ